MTALVLTALALDLAAYANVARADVLVSASIRIAPPPIPVYEQPACPGDGYLWTPGYWAWDAVDYYWVPGTWVLAPQPGFLWTPGYWSFTDSVYVFHEGYWGPHVGFYGGINYGFGYGGVGFEGGYWNANRFYYNRSVTRVNETIVQNVYTKTVVNNVTINRVSFNGGNEGVQARPSAAERQAERETHLPAVAEQTRHIASARSNPQLRASANHGRPPIAATQKAGEFRRNVAGASHVETALNQSEARNRSDRPVHARDLAPRDDGGSADLESGARAERQALHARQERERQELEGRQDAEHAQMERQQVNAERRQQMEVEHERQTHELAQRHEQEENEFLKQHPQKKKKEHENER